MDAERWEKIRATRARTMFLKKQREALALGLGDAAPMAKDIEDGHKRYMKDFRLNPNKGVQHRKTVARRVAKQEKQRRDAYDRDYNPKIKGLQGVNGITTEEDGTIRLQELRKQRPDIFEMTPIPVKGREMSDRMLAIAEKRKKEGRYDRYAEIVERYTGRSSEVSPEAEEE
jgi:hypothetical protein